jgi:hypothetical protein
MDHRLSGDEGAGWVFYDTHMHQIRNVRHFFAVRRYFNPWRLGEKKNLNLKFFNRAKGLAFFYVAAQKLARNLIIVSKDKPILARSYVWRKRTDTKKSKNGGVIWTHASQS